MNYTDMQKHKMLQNWCLNQACILNYTLGLMFGFEEFLAMILRHAHAIIDPPEPRFYIVKLWFSGLYIFFFIFSISVILLMKFCFKRDML